jgi:hypothetical protein
MCHLRTPYVASKQAMLIVLVVANAIVHIRWKTDKRWTEHRAECMAHIQEHFRPEALRREAERPRGPSALQTNAVWQRSYGSAQCELW